MCSTNQEAVSNVTAVTRHRIGTSNLLHYANKSRMEGHFNDVTVIAANQRIPANRMILSWHSVFFEKMFKCSMKEKYERNVEIQNVDGLCLKVLIDYIYIGHIDIDEENVMKLLAASDYLQIEDVKQYCFDFLKSVITADNWFIVLNAVVMYRGEAIKDQVYDYISTHFDEIVRTDDFKRVSDEELGQCIANLNRNVVKETSIYQSIMNWVEHDPEERKHKVLNLLQLLKVDQLPYEFVEACSKENFLENNIECQKFLFNVLLQTLKSQRDEMHGSKIISVGGVKNLSKITEVYNMRDNKPADYPDFPVPVSGHDLLKLNNYVFCLGGKLIKDNCWKVTKRVWFYHVKDKSMKWKEAAPMIDERNLMGATVHNDKLVVAGGHNGQRSVDAAEFYEMPLNRWNPISPLNQTRSGNALVSCKNCLYTLGGWGSGNYLSSVEMLRETDGEWEEVQPMQKCRNWLAAVSCGNVIYAIGGKSGEAPDTTTKTVEKYDPDKKKWIYVSEMNHERRTHAACVVGGLIYVVGGTNAENQAVKTIECYFPSKDLWSVIGETKDKLFHHSIVAI